MIALAIHLIPKWGPINYFFVSNGYQPSLPRFHFKILLFFIHADEAKKLINMQTKEQFIGRHFGIRCIGDLHFLS